MSLRRGENMPVRGSVLLLEEDPDLAQELPERDRQVLRDLLRAAVLHVNPPRWIPPQLGQPRTFGLLVLDGLLARRSRLGHAVGTELLGCGDILRPWDEPTPWDMVAPEISWRVFEPVRLAILDERVTTIIGRRPELVVAFSSRLFRRSRNAAYLATITHLPRVQDRLLLALWHLATNWGRVTPHGVVVPFRLTHEVFGEIIGAQRPSVTTAMAELQRAGHLTRADDGRYVLTGTPEEALRAAVARHLTHA